MPSRQNQSHVYSGGYSQKQQRDGNAYNNEQYASTYPEDYTNSGDPQAEGANGGYNGGYNNGYPEAAWWHGGAGYPVPTSGGESETWLDQQMYSQQMSNLHPVGGGGGGGHMGQQQQMGGGGGNRRPRHWNNAQQVNGGETMAMQDASGQAMPQPMDDASMMRNEFLAALHAARSTLMQAQQQAMMEMQSRMHAMHGNHRGGGGHGAQNDHRQQNSKKGSSKNSEAKTKKGPDGEQQRASKAERKAANKAARAAAAAAMGAVRLTLRATSADTLVLGLRCGS